MAEGRLDRSANWAGRSHLGNDRQTFLDTYRVILSLEAGRFPTKHGAGTFINRSKMVGIPIDCT